jgi:anti-sigma B factor antagonist
LDVTSYQRLVGGPGGLKLAVARLDDVVLARVRGELDLKSVAAFEAAMDEAAHAPCRRLVLDLRELDFIDSTGLHAITALGKRLIGSELLLVRGPASVHRPFELVGLDRRLTFVDALD